MDKIPVYIFSRPSCPFCVRAKDFLLSQESLEVFEVVLDEQSNYEEAREMMVEWAEGKTSVPQIFVRGIFLPGGCTALLLGGLKRIQETKGEEIKGFLTNQTLIWKINNISLKRKGNIPLQEEGLQLLKVEPLDF